MLRAGPHQRDNCNHLHFVDGDAAGARELVDDFRKQRDRDVVIESVGGVDAAKRVQAGEVFDVVVLASEVVDKLISSGHVVGGSRVDLVRSGVALAVRAGAPHPDVTSEEALRQAVVAARNVSYSTGPSGVHLAKVFERVGHRRYHQEQDRPRRHRGFRWAGWSRGAKWNWVFSS
jgi:ABC-type molybdate transport system substrate-binding protein